MRASRLSFHERPNRPVPCARKSRIGRGYLTVNFRTIVPCMWNTCGPDTVHLTYKQGPNRTPEEFACLLAEFQRTYELPTGTVIRDKGLQGFAAAAVDDPAGLRLDWTRVGEQGNNEGFFCLQVKGKWFTAADGETTADFLQLLQAYGPYRCTRIDFQQTTETKKHLTPFWIEQFEAGNYRVIGKKAFEPRGLIDIDGGSSAGRSLYHGSRQSERFIRQYDKHLESKEGPPRRRDEIEAKGHTARELWTALHSELLDREQQGMDRGATLTAFSKSTIRSLIPIRDTSRWAGKPLPKRWTEMAKEPLTWSTLFSGDGLSVKPRQRTVSSLLKSYRYASENFGAAVSVMAALRVDMEHQGGITGHDADWNGYASIVDDFVKSANEEKAMAFLKEFPEEQRKRLRSIWLSMAGAAGTNIENQRD